MMLPRVPLMPELEQILMAAMTSPQMWGSVDGAGKFSNSQFICQAMCVAEVSEFERFGAAWRDLLSKNGIAWLSMKEAMGFDGPFKSKALEWGREKESRRDDLLEDFASCIRSHGIAIFAFGVDANAFTQKQAKAGEFRLFVRLLEMVTTRMPHGSGLMIVSDEDESLGPQIYEFFRRIRKNPQTVDIARKIKLLAIGDDQAFAEIQAADILAGSMCEEMRRRRSAIPGSPAKVYEILTGNGSEGIGVSIGEIFEPTEFIKASGIR